MEDFELPEEQYELEFDKSIFDMQTCITKLTKERKIHPGDRILLLHYLDAIDGAFSKYGSVVLNERIMDAQQSSRNVLTAAIAGIISKQ